MNPDTRFWVFRLLFAALITVVGVVGVVAEKGFRERGLLRGVLGQGILMAIVIGAASFPERTELRLGGLVVVASLIIQAAWEYSSSSEELVTEEGQPFTGNSEEQTQIPV